MHWFPPRIARYSPGKGGDVNGVSLTINALDGDSFRSI